MARNAVVPTGDDTGAPPEFAAVIGDRRWRGADTIVDLDPSSRTPLAHVACCGAAEVDEAVAAAHEAIAGWRGLGPGGRGPLLRRLAELIRGHAEELSILESRDVGKPVSQARAEIGLSARYFDYYADAATTLHGETIPISDELFGYTVREPFGVVGHIVPWNYPLPLATRTIAPSVAVGNCSVVKPAEDAPLTVIRLAELALEADFPPGVLNVVPGYGDDAGAALAAHPGIALLSFTGSVETGRKVAHGAAENCIPVMLELGGKSPNIIFGDANLGEAVPAVVQSIIQNCGQTCSAGTRVLVEDKVHDTVVEQLLARFESIRMGPGVDDPDLGPLVSDRQLARVQELVSAGRDEAELITGGGPPEDEVLQRGCFFAPTLFDDVPAQARIAQEEIFGPVLVVQRFGDVEEAHSLADATRYGLAAGVWTRDAGKAHWLAHRIQAGQVFLNTFSGGSVEFPFGGYKYSGHGREKGLEALKEYTQCKTVGVRMHP